jgi:hypothetical protein
VQTIVASLAAVAVLGMGGVCIGSAAPPAGGIDLAGLPDEFLRDGGIRRDDAGGRGNARDVEPGKAVSLAGMTVFWGVVPFVTTAYFLPQMQPEGMDPYHRFADAFRGPPTWDEDTAFWNYWVHPWMGSEWYLAARNRAGNPWGCMAYSAALSAWYEYVPGNMLQQPSATDLIVTPLTGVVLGEARYRLRRWLARGHSGARMRRALVVLVDPL